MRRLVLVTLLFAGACTCAPDLTAQQKCNWTQWAQSGAHQGNACAVAQNPGRALAKVTFDPFVPQEQAENPDDGQAGDLVDHFPAPLVVDDDVYMLVKTGSYIPCEPPGSGQLADGGFACGSGAWDSQVWNLRAFHWNGDSLQEQWTFASDWKPAPAFIAAWEPMFQAAVAGDFIYVPQVDGQLAKLDRKTGALKATIDPFHAQEQMRLGVRPNTFVLSGLSVDAHGDIFYTAAQFDLSNLRNDAQGFLVRVDSGDGFITAPFATLVPNAPPANSACPSAFNQPPYQRPFPPVDDAGAFLPEPQTLCQSPRPSVNAVPALGPDGTVYVVSRNHRNSRFGFVVAATHDLRPKWSTSLRGILNDGCGVLDPSTGVPNPDGGETTTGLCRVGAPLGVDPATNDVPAARVDDSSSSSITVLPDGLLYGAVTNYNTARGHLIKLGFDGTVRGTYDFGWDTTPAVWKHDGTYSIVIKDNHYFEWDGSAPRFFLTQLDKNLHVEWQYKNTNTKSCARQTDGSLQCADDHPNGFEWCINAPVVDAEGNVLANAEDGNLYVVRQGGTEKARFFLKLALGAAYTPLVVDARGRIYALNGGELTVIGE